MYKTVIVCRVGLFRDLMEKTLQGAPSFTVVGTFEEFDAALMELEELTPALTIAVLARQSVSEAMDFVQQVRVIAPTSKIAFLYRDAESHIVEQLTEEIDDPRELSFLQTESINRTEELFSALAGVASGLTLWDRRLTRNGRDSFRTAVDDITRRDLEVLGLLASGMSNRGIADKLDLSVETVKSSVSRIYQELGIDKANNPEKHPRVLAAMIYRQCRGNVGLESLARSGS